MPGKDDRTYDQKRRDAQYEIDQKLREGTKQTTQPSSSGSSASSANSNSTKSS